MALNYTKTKEMVLGLRLFFSVWPFFVLAPFSPYSGSMVTEGRCSCSVVGLCVSQTEFTPVGLVVSADIILLVLRGFSHRPLVVAIGELAEWDILCLYVASCTSSVWYGRATSTCSSMLEDWTRRRCRQLDATTLTWCVMLKTQRYTPWLFLVPWAIVEY